MCHGATAARALKSVLQGILLSSDGEKLNSMNLLLYMAPIAVLFLIPATLLMEENMVGITIALARDDIKIIFYLLFNSALAYCVNLTNFLVTKHTSALTLQIASSLDYPSIALSQSNGKGRGSVRQEHIVIESKPDHFLDDLLLNSPWPELRSFAETIDLNVADSVVHKHTPYVIILLKVADEWAKTHGGSLPSTREEKKEFKELIRARLRAMDKDNYKEMVEALFKVFAPRGISSNLQRIINDSCADVDSNSFDFWVMVAALKI